MQDVVTIELSDIDDWDNEPTEVMAIQRAATVPEFLDLPPEHWSRRLAKEPSPDFNDVDRAAIPLVVL